MPMCSPGLGFMKRYLTISKSTIASGNGYSIDYMMLRYAERQSWFASLVRAGYEFMNPNPVGLLRNVARILALLLSKTRDSKRRRVFGIFAGNHIIVFSASLSVQFYFEKKKLKNKGEVRYCFKNSVAVRKMKPRC